VKPIESTFAHALHVQMYFQWVLPKWCST